VIGDALVRDGLRILGHRERQEPTRTAALCPLALHRKLEGCAAEHTRENGSRCVIDTEPAAELTGIVPARGARAITATKIIQTLRNARDEWRDARAGRTKSERATRIHGEDVA
jgi:hypothetical protein